MIRQSNAPAFSRLPNGQEPPVYPFLSAQFRVGTLLGNAAGLDHQGLAGILDGSQPVGNDKHGFPLHQGTDHQLNKMLVFGSTLAVTASKITMGAAFLQT
ncbi:MAG: hypothetical protein K0R22_829 [Sporomusa sp.]|nr:hypothetical protein [Sporomusa sp.]